MPPFRFYLITDRLHSRHDPAQALPALYRAGLRALQVREKDLAPATMYRYGRWLHGALPQGHDLQMFLNDRADIALALGFAGVHLRADSLPLAAQPAVLRERLIYGVSTHSLAEVRAAEAAGAAFATFGPVFETASKAEYGPPVGLDALAEAAAQSNMPLFALGGVTPQRVADCRAAGAHGVAAIGAVWHADDPVAALAEFREALGEL